MPCCSRRGDWRPRVSPSCLRSGTRDDSFLHPESGGYGWRGCHRRTPAILLRRAGAESLAPGVLDRVIEFAGGNPLALLELPGGLSPAQRAGAEPLPAHLPVGERIRRAYLDRVAGLPESSQLLLLLAATEPSGDLGLLSRAAR